MGMRLSQLKRGSAYVVTSSVLMAILGCSSSDYTMTKNSLDKASGLSISSLSPDSGSHLGGTTVKITGSGFVDGQTSVYFDDYQAKSTTFISSEEIQVETPASDRLFTNSVDVKVVVSSPTGDIEVLSKGGFTYTNGLYCEDGEDGKCVATCDDEDDDDSCPFIYEIDPDSMIYSATERSVTIFGENLGSEGLRVAIGSVDLTGCSYSYDSDDEVDVIGCTIPTLSQISLGTQDVLVEFEDTDGKKWKAIYEDGFTFLDSSSGLTPTITKIDPPQGNWDDQEIEVTIEGTNFLVNDDEDNERTFVYFGDIRATECEVEDETTIYCTPPSPLEAIGAVNVRVVVMGDDGVEREVIKELGYAYIDEASPTITSISPEKGVIGTEVVIEGTNFIEDETSVSFGKGDDFTEAEECTITEEGKKITCQAPDAEMEGKVDVMVEVFYDDELTRYAVLQDGFEYEEESTECDSSLETCGDDDDDDDDDDDENDDENGDGVTISKIDPSTAKTNSKINFKVWGTGFKKNRTSVMIGNQLAKKCKVHKGKDGEEGFIKCKTPKISEIGEYDLMVIVKSKKGSKKEEKSETKEEAFTIEDPTAEVGDVTITKFEPKVGEANKKTTFKVFGTGFKKKKRMEVMIGDLTATCDKVKLQSGKKEDGSKSSDEDWIRCKTPKLSAEKYSVSVTVKAKKSKKGKKGKKNNKSNKSEESDASEDVTVVAAEQFEFQSEELYNAPTISSIVPNVAAENKKTKFKIKGTNFSSNMKVEIGGKSATCETPNLAKKDQKNKNGKEKEDNIKCETPKMSSKSDGSYYSVKITVNHNKKDSDTNKVKREVELADGFKFTEDESSKAPTIVSVEPSVANVNEKMEFKLKGAYFVANKKKTTVKIGNKEAKCGTAVLANEQDGATGAELYTMTCNTPNIEYAGSYDLKVSKRYREDGKQKRVHTVWSDGDGNENNKFTIEDSGTTGENDDKKLQITTIDPGSIPEKTKTSFTVYGKNFKVDKTRVWIDKKEAKKCKVVLGTNGGDDSVTCKSKKMEAGTYYVKVKVGKKQTTKLEAIEVTGQ